MNIIISGNLKYQFILGIIKNNKGKASTKY